MSVERVLEKLQSYVREGMWLPGGYRILSAERIDEFVDKIRDSLPNEIGRAKVIARDGDLLVRNAQERAEAMLAEASAKHEELLDEHEIVRRARATAEAVLRDAQERAKKVREGADHYAEQMLAELEGRLGGALASVRKGRDALAGRVSPPAATVAATNDPLADAAAKSKRLAFDAQAPEEAEVVEVGS
uniref:Putative Vacuolar-type H+-ATPase subunit H n=1 Tax=mine drainage metagenome TaxID=410659 RepID=E6PCG0_9ZZZZ